MDLASPHIWWITLACLISILLFRYFDHSKFAIYQSFWRLINWPRIFDYTFVWLIWDEISFLRSRLIFLTGALPHYWLPSVVYNLVQSTVFGCNLVRVMWFHNRIVAWFSVSCLFRMEQLVEILCFLKLLLSYTWIELAFLYFNLLALLLIHKSWGNGFCIVCQIEALFQIWLTLILADNRHCIEVLSLDLFLVSRRDWKTVISRAVTFFKPFICFVKLTCILILSNLKMALDMINYLTWQMAIVLDICFQLAWRIHVVFENSRLLRIVWQIFLTPTFVRNRVQRISPVFVLFLIV